MAAKTTAKPTTTDLIPDAGEVQPSDSQPVQDTRTDEMRAADREIAAQDQKLFATHVSVPADLLDAKSGQALYRLLWVRVPNPEMAAKLLPAEGSMAQQFADKAIEGGLFARVEVSEHEPTARTKTAWEAAGLPLKHYGHEIVTLSDQPIGERAVREKTSTLLPAERATRAAKAAVKIAHAEGVTDRDELRDRMLSAFAREAQAAGKSEKWARSLFEAVFES